MNKNLLIGLGVLFAVVIVGFYFIKSPKLNYGPANKVAPVTSSIPTTSAVPSGSVHEVSVTAAEFAYTPSTITVKSGEKVKIDFENVGTVSHNLTFQGLNLATNTIGPGQTDTLTFTAPAAGSYTFYCSIDGHKGLGLQGTLIVK